MKKILIIISVIFLSVFAFFFSNIKGYYRFKQYCEAEGGLRVYEPLEKGVGWLAKDKYEAQTAALINYVGFVRYTDKDGKTYDVRYVGGNPTRDGSFDRQLADELKSLSYKWRYINQGIPNELRLGRHGYEVLDIKSNNILVRFYMFGYSRLEPSHTILAGPSGIGCFDEFGVLAEDPSRWRKEINTAFKN